MKMFARSFVAGLALVCLLASTPLLFAGDTIPKTAWKRGIGQPLDNPGGRKPALGAGMIDDGYWQGAPVGGFGSGTFSRTYRGDFSRWHIKSGVHKYQTVWTNQFAMYQKQEGGAGDYYSLYPKSWYDYRWEKFPAHVVLEQFSPVLPNNYRESSYPVAVYRWHAENPTDKPVTVSVLLSWTNMLGWFRDFGPDMKNSMDHGNHNRFVDDGAMGEHVKGIVFDRVHPKGVQDDFDGQWAIASVESPGVDITYQTTYIPFTPGQEVWGPFSRMGALQTTTWRGSAAESLWRLLLRCTSH